MVAILPHQEVQTDVTPAEEAQDSRGRNDAQVVYDTHAGLLNMVYVRQVVEHALVGRTVTVKFDVVTRRATGQSVVVSTLVLDQGLPQVPAWNPVPGGGRNYELLSWTSKMGCPSWSLPAGAPNIGGACPGAIAGQSTSQDGVAQQNKHILRVLGAPVDLANSVCQRCYATGGQYSTGQVQVAQLLRYHWTRYALRNNTFVTTMVYAIAGADFELDGGPEGGSVGERTGKRFFRIHDSGDFFDSRYLRAWFEIAAALPDITFWAPSRIWATTAGKEEIAALAPMAPNLIIRPSAYHVNQHGPDLAGWAKCSTVYHKSQTAEGQDSTFDWNCRAYIHKDTKTQKHTCRTAQAPNAAGKPTPGEGCRACWIHPHLRINYTEH